MNSLNRQPAIARKCFLRNELSSHLHQTLRNSLEIWASRRKSGVHGKPFSVQFRGASRPLVLRRGARLCAHAVLRSAPRGAPPRPLPLARHRLRAAFPKSGRGAGGTVGARRASVANRDATAHPRMSNCESPPNHQGAVAVVFFDPFLIFHLIRAALSFTVAAH